MQRRRTARFQNMNPAQEIKDARAARGFAVRRRQMKKKNRRRRSRSRSRSSLPLICVKRNGPPLRDT
jgi:hypothetical protein